MADGRLLSAEDIDELRSKLKSSAQSFAHSIDFVPLDVAHGVDALFSTTEECRAFFDRSAAQSVEFGKRLARDIKAATKLFGATDAKTASAKRALSEFQAANKQGLVPLNGLLALLEEDFLWKPFLDVVLIPFDAAGCNGVVFRAVQPPDGSPRQELFLQARTAVANHFQFSCNKCRGNIRLLSQLLDARGSVLARCLEGVSAPWAVRARELHRAFISASDFVPLFPSDNKQHLWIAPEVAWGASLFGATPPEAERQQFPGLVARGGGFQLAVEPEAHAGFKEIGNAEPPAQNATFPESVTDMFGTVRIFALGPVYIRTAMQSVKRMSEALAEIRMPPKLTSRDRRNILHKAMAKNANAWALTDGITTKVAAGPGAAEDESALSVILEWNNVDNSNKKVYDLDLEVLYCPLDGQGSVQRVYYGAKYFCTHSGCRKFLSQTSGGLCPEEGHGTAHCISLVHDVQHPAGKGTEEVKVGAAVEGRIAVTVRDFNSGSTTYATAVVYQVSVRAGKQFANKVIRSSRRLIPRDMQGRKHLYDSAGLECSILKTVGIESPEDTSSFRESAEVGHPAESIPVLNEDLEERLRSGGGITLPIPAEALGANNKYLDDAETDKAKQVVRDYFGGDITGKLLSLPQLNILWERGAAAASQAVDLSEYGLPPEFVSALQGGGDIHFPVLNQTLLAPAFALQYSVNGAPLPGPSPSFAAIITSGLPARDGTKPFSAANSTGMFTPAEWQRTVRLLGSSGSGQSVVLKAIVATPRHGYLFFVVDSVPNAEAPSKNGYALSLPTLPLASRAAKAPNHKEVRPASAC